MSVVQLQLSTLLLLWALAVLGEESSHPKVRLVANPGKSTDTLYGFEHGVHTHGSHGGHGLHGGPQYNGGHRQHGGDEYRIGLPFQGPTNSFPVMQDKYGEDTSNNKEE